MPLLTPHVPKGLIDLMKDLAKEVLRDKPENIYEFAAVHFEKLIQQRDGSLNKGYEEFVAFEALFDGQQRFEIPANCGFTCRKAIKTQSRKSKSDIMTGFKAMESINEEDTAAENLYTDEKYQKAIYVIQRYYRRYAAKKKENPSSTTPLTAATAAIIIQRTMRRLFANKIKLKTAGDDTAKRDGVVQDDVDNVSEAASYTSSSTIQMLADSQEGRENRLSGREVSDGGSGDDGSTEFKEQTTVAQDEPRVAEDNEENSEVAPTEMNRKSIADENGKSESIHQEDTPPDHPPAALEVKDTSTAHIGILSTVIGSNDQQNSLHTNTVEIDSNSSDSTQKQKSVTDIVTVGDFPLNFPQSLGTTPDTFPATSPRQVVKETFAIRLQDDVYAANNIAYPNQGNVQVRKFDPDTRESLKIYDVFYQDKDDPDFSDSLNESTMERDSLENEDLDVDSLESNENLIQNVSGIVKREVREDDGSLYEDTDELQQEVESEGHDVQRLIELERMPSYLYGIHPPRTPVVERKHIRSKNSAESRKLRDTKDLDATLSFAVEDKTPEEKSEDMSLESKESTSEDSSVTQIENVLQHNEKYKIDNSEDDFKDIQPTKIIQLTEESSTNPQKNPIEIIPNAYLDENASNVQDELKIDGKTEFKTDKGLSKELKTMDTRTPDDETKTGPAFDNRGSSAASEDVPQVDKFIQSESKYSDQQDTSDEGPHRSESRKEDIETPQMIDHTTLRDEVSLEPNKNAIDRMNLSTTYQESQSTSSAPHIVDPNRPEKLHPLLAAADNSEHDLLAKADMETSARISETGIIQKANGYKKDDAILKTNGKILPDKQRLKSEESKSETSLKDSLKSDQQGSTDKTQEFVQNPNAASTRVESGLENEEKTTKDELLDEIEVSDDQAEKSAHRQKRSLKVNVVPPFSEYRNVEGGTNYLSDDLKTIGSSSATADEIASVTEHLIESSEEKIDHQAHLHDDNTPGNEKSLEIGPKKDKDESKPISEQGKNDEGASSSRNSDEKSKNVSNSLLIESLVPRPSSPLGYFATLYSDHNFSRPTSSLSGHQDTEVEAQLRELQSLNNLYPGLEIRDIISEFHTKDIQPDERRSIKDLEHDANNNVEGFETSSEHPEEAVDKDVENNENADSKTEELQKNTAGEEIGKVILNKEYKRPMEIEVPSQSTFNVEFGSKDENGDKEEVNVKVAPLTSVVPMIPKEINIEPTMADTEQFKRSHEDSVKDDNKIVVPRLDFEIVNSNLPEKSPEASKKLFKLKSDKVTDNDMPDTKVAAQTRSTASEHLKASEGVNAPVSDPDSTKDNKSENDFEDEDKQPIKSFELQSNNARDREPIKEEEDMEIKDEEIIGVDEENKSLMLKIAEPSIIKESTTSAVETVPEEEHKLQGEDYFGKTIDKVQPNVTAAIEILKIEGLGHSSSISRLDSRDKLPKVDEETNDFDYITGKVDKSGSDQVTVTEKYTDQVAKLNGSTEKEHSSTQVDRPHITGKAVPSEDLTDVGKEISELEVTNLKLAETDVKLPKEHIHEERFSYTKPNITEETSLTDVLKNYKAKTILDEGDNGQKEEQEKEDINSKAKERSKEYKGTSSSSKSIEAEDISLPDALTKKTKTDFKEQDDNRNNADNTDKLISTMEHSKTENINELKGKPTLEVQKKGASNIELPSKSSDIGANLAEDGSSSVKEKNMEFSDSEIEKREHTSDINMPGELRVIPKGSDLEKMHTIPEDNFPSDNLKGNQREGDYLANKNTHVSGGLETNTKAPDVKKEDVSDLESNSKSNNKSGSLSVKDANMKHIKPTSDTGELETKTKDTQSPEGREEDLHSGTSNSKPENIGENLSPEVSSALKVKNIEVNEKATNKHPSNTVPPEELETNLKDRKDLKESIDLKKLLDTQPETKEANYKIIGKDLETDVPEPKLLENLTENEQEKEPNEKSKTIPNMEADEQNITSALIQAEQLSNWIIIEEKPVLKALTSESQSSPDQVKTRELSKETLVLEVQLPAADVIKDEPELENLVAGVKVYSDRIEDERLSDVKNVNVSGASPIEIKPDLEAQIVETKASTNLIEDKQLTGRAEAIVPETSLINNELIKEEHVSHVPIEDEQISNETLFIDVKLPEEKLIKDQPNLEIFGTRSDVAPDHIASDQLKDKSEVKEPSVSVTKTTKVAERNISLDNINPEQVSHKYPALENEHPETSTIEGKSCPGTLVPQKNADRNEDYKPSDENLALKEKTAKGIITENPEVSAENILPDHTQPTDLVQIKDELHLDAVNSGEKSDQIVAVEEAIIKPESFTEAAALKENFKDHIIKDEKLDTPIQDENKTESLQLKELSDETSTKDNFKIKSDPANLTDQLNSMPSSASMPTEVTSCDESNAETSADFSSIGKDLDFFEDTISYLKNATTLLGTMDGAFDNEKKKEQPDGTPYPTVLVHLAEDLPLEDDNNDLKDKTTEEELEKVKTEKEKKNDKSDDNSTMSQDEFKSESKTPSTAGDTLSQAALIIQSAIRGYRVRKALKQKHPVAEEMIKRNKRSILSEAPRPADLLSQAAVVIQSAIRGYRVRRALSTKIKQTELEVDDKVSQKSSLEKSHDPSQIHITTSADDKSNSPNSIKIELDDNLEKSQAPIAVIHPTKHLTHPTVVVHLAEDLPDDDEVDVPKLDQAPEGVDPVKEHQSDKNQKEIKIESEKPQNVVIDEAQVTKHVIRPTTLPARITREKPLERNLKSMKDNGFNQALNDSNRFAQQTEASTSHKRPTTDKVSIVKSMSLDDTQQAKASTTSERKPKAFKSDSLNQRKHPISREKPIEIRSKIVKIDAVKHPSTNNTTTERKPLEKDNSKILKSKIPSTSNLQQRPGLVKNKRQQFGRKGRSMSVNEKTQNQDVFDLEAIKKELLSKKVKSPPQSGRKSKVTAKADRSVKILDKRQGNLSKISDASKKSEGGTLELSTNPDGADSNKQSDTDSKCKDLSTESKVSEHLNSEESLSGTEEGTESTHESQNNLEHSDRSETSCIKEHPVAIETTIGTANEISDHLKDSALQKSATTIQKTFRGYKTRQNLRKSVPELSHHPDEFIKPGIKDSKITDVISDSTPIIQKVEAVLELDQKDIQESSPKTKDDDERKTKEAVTSVSLMKDMEDLKNSTLEKSATKIQKTFRGYKSRKDLRKSKRNSDQSTKLRTSKEETEHILNDGAETHKTFANEDKDSMRKKEDEEELLNQTIGVIDSFDVEEFQNAALQKSATTIQKTFRGYKTRKELISKNETGQRKKEKLLEKKGKSDNISDDSLRTNQKLKLSKADEPESEDISRKHSEDEVAPIMKSGEDMQSNELLNKAAVTIQKTYKGYKTRKEFLVGDKLHQKKDDNDINKNQEEINDQKDKVLSESEVKSDFSTNFLNQEKHNDTKDLNTDTIKAKEVTDIDLFGSEKLTQNALSNNVILEGPADRSIVAKTIIKSTSAGALLEEAASTIQKAYRDYHTRKDSIPTKKLKSYSLGTHRESTFKDAIENSDESSTFIGPDTSFDLSDFESEKLVSNPERRTSTDTPTLTYDNEKLDEVDSNIFNSPTFAINIHSEGHEHETDSSNTNILFIPQEIRRKKSIIDPTAPLLEEILNVDANTTAEQKPQWYVGDDLIIPTEDINLSSETSSILNPLASSSSIEKLSSIDARNKNLNSNLQLTPSINSAVVSTSSLLFANDTEMHDKKLLNNHSRAVSAKEEKEEENNLEVIKNKEDFKEEKKSEEIDRIEEVKTESIEIAKAEDLSNGLAATKETSNYLYSTDPFAPRSAGESVNDKKAEESEAIVTELCKNCADGIHETGIVGTSPGQKSIEAELSKENLSQVANVEDKKDVSDSPEKHFDEIKQFVLMEELNSTKSETANNDYEKVNETNGNKNRYDTEISLLEETHKEQSANNVEKTVGDQMQGSDGGESSVVAVKVIDEDNQEIQHKDLIHSNYPTISLIPPSSEDDTSDREFTQGEKVCVIDENDLTARSVDSIESGLKEEEVEKLKDYEEEKENGLSNKEQKGEKQSLVVTEETATVVNNENKGDVEEGNVGILESKTEEDLAINTIKDQQSNNKDNNQEEQPVLIRSTDTQMGERTRLEDDVDINQEQQKESHSVLQAENRKEEGATKSEEVKIDPPQDSDMLNSDENTNEKGIDVTYAPESSKREDNSLKLKTEEGKKSALGKENIEEELVGGVRVDSLSESQDSCKPNFDKNTNENGMEVTHGPESPKPEDDALKLKTKEETPSKGQKFEDDLSENTDVGADDKAVVENLISPTKLNSLSSEKSVENAKYSQSTVQKSLVNSKDIKNGSSKDVESEPSGSDSKQENGAISKQTSEDIIPKDHLSKTTEDTSLLEERTDERKLSGDKAVLSDETIKPDKDELIAEIETISKRMKPKVPSDESKSDNTIDERRHLEDEMVLNGAVEPIAVQLTDVGPTGTEETNEKSDEDIDSKSTDHKDEKHEQESILKIAHDADKSTEKPIERGISKDGKSTGDENKDDLKKIISMEETDQNEENPDRLESALLKDSNKKSERVEHKTETASETPSQEDMKIVSALLEGNLEFKDKAAPQVPIDEISTSGEQIALLKDGSNLDQIEASDKSKDKNEESASLNDKTQTTSKESETPPQEDLEIASKLLEVNLESNDEQKSKVPLDIESTSDEQVLLEHGNKLVSDTSQESAKSRSSIQEKPSKDKECSSELDLEIQEKLEKLMEEDLSHKTNAHSIDIQNLPTENAPVEVVEITCIKKIIPPTIPSATSDQDESELESTTTKADSTTTSPGYDDASENDALEIPPSIPDNLEGIAEKLRETEAMVARMHQRRASEHMISIDSVDQPPVFDEPICEPIKPMQELQKSNSTEVEDDIILKKLQRGDTSRESSAQSESVIYGDSTSQLIESDDTFNENMDLRTLHRMNTIAAERSTYKPQNLLFKSVTIDDTVKYIDPEKSTEESGGSFCMDDDITADVRKKMMAYSVSEADSDYYDAGELTSRQHDDFNISTALDTYPSSDTDTTIISAATKIQAGARGFLTRRRLRRASMGTKSSLTEETKTSFGNDAIGESLDSLVEEEVGKRMPKVQYHRQVGVNSLPSALGNSNETENVRLSPTREEIHTGGDSDDLNLAEVTSTTQPHGEWSSIDGQGERYNLSTSSENDVNGGIAEEDDSAQLPSNLEATLAARRLTLQRGDAMRNDSTPDDDNGNGKQVDPPKNIPATIGIMSIHEKTKVESTTTTTTTTTTERRNYSDAGMATKMEKVKWFAMRQNSMPVQIDSEVFRVLPKHMRKRIKSAEGEKKKRIRLPRD